ncbi:MAG: protein translocase subunit SecF [Acidimicrobiales bacterium]
MRRGDTSSPGGEDRGGTAGTSGAELEEAFEEELEEAADRHRSEGGSHRRPNVLIRLYRGQTAFDFIGNRRWWFTASILVILIGILSIGVRGFNWSIDFKGGQSWEVSSPTLTVARATSAVEAAGLGQPTVVQFTNQLNHTRQIEVTANLNGKSPTQRTTIGNQVQDALARAAHTSIEQVSINDVGASWGSQVTARAIEALIVFFIAVTLYISVRFEFKMAVAAIIAVIHDILVTAGIYSLTGFQVTPDTVVAVLTVLGYSLYDTVVVFDRIRENSNGLGASGRITYSEMVNLSMNQTLARSINTSLVAIMPVLSVLVVGALFLGAISLENFGLALVIGLTSGAYSSIFIASPLLSMMKEREPRYVTIRQRLETRGDRVGVLTPAAAAAMMGGGAGGGRSQVRARAQAAGVIRPRGAVPSTRASTAVADPPLGTPGAAAEVTGAGPAAPRGSSGATRPGGNRPPPRPRKGKGKAKGKRR